MGPGPSRSCMTQSDNNLWNCRRKRALPISSTDCHMEVNSLQKMLIIRMMVQVSIEAFEDQLTLCLYRRPFENEPMLRWLHLRFLFLFSFENKPIMLSKHCWGELNLFLVTFYWRTNTQGQVSSDEHHCVPGSINLTVSTRPSPPSSSSPPPPPMVVHYHHRHHHVTIIVIKMTITITIMTIIVTRRVPSRWRSHFVACSSTTLQVL